MSKEKRVAFMLNEQLWKKVKTLQINSDVKSLNDIFIILSLQFANNQITVPDSYDMSAELQSFLNQSRMEIKNVAS